MHQLRGPMSANPTMAMLVNGAGDFVAFDLAGHKYV